MSADLDRPSVRWMTSSYSQGDGGDCVEVARGLIGVVPVRDSKAPDRAVLSFPVAGWTSFVSSVRGGAFPTS
jgi:hypothetical protein